MSAVAQIVNAEMYKFFRSKIRFSSLIIMTLVSAFLFLSLPSSADWRDKLEQGNISIEQQLNMTAEQIHAESGTANVYIKQWKENEAYLQNNIVPPQH